MASTDADLDAQMDEIGKEEVALEAQAAELRSKISGADSISANISSAQASWRISENGSRAGLVGEKRRLIEVLVGGVRVDIVEEGGVKHLRSGSCTSARTLSPRFLQALRLRNALL